MDRKDVPHHFSLVTDTAKALLLITPAGIETFFKEFSVPAQSLELPPIPEGQPPAEFLDQHDEASNGTGCCLDA